MVDTRSSSADMVFLGQNEGEKCHFFFRQHWIRLLWPLCRVLLASIVIIAVLFVLFYGQETAPMGSRRIFLLFLVATWIFTHQRFMIRLYHYFLYVIIVTDKKIHRIKKTLLSLDDHETIDLWLLQDINKSQHSIVQNILGFGTLTCEAQDTHLKIHFTPRIADKYHKIQQVREQARAKMTYTGVSPRKKAGT